MSAESELQARATQIVDDAMARARGLEKELLALEARKLVIEEQLRTAQNALQRLDSFRIRIGAEFQCPSCWINHGAWSSLTPLTGTSREDFFRCRVCRFEFSAAA
jgi:hypothetical protein